MDFPWLVRQAGEAKADLLIAPSLDWDSAKRSHAQIATVRAVENRLSILRPTGDGLSLAVDQLGRVLAASDSFTSDKPVFMTAIPANGVSTVYVTIGDSFAYVCAASLILLTGLAFAPRHTPSLAETAVSQPP